MLYLCIAKAVLFCLNWLKINMKKIKRKDIDSNKLLTKAEYARRQKVSHTEINRQILAGKLTIVVTLDNKELIHL